MIRFAFIVLCLICVAVPARADTRLRDCPWGPELPPGAAIASGGVGGSEVLGLAGPTPPEGTRLMRVETSGLASRHIALTGQIDCSAAQGAVRLTLWVEFPDGKRYFSRTDVPQTSVAGWRDFALPMHSVDSSAVRVELWVESAGAGTILFGPANLWDVTPASRAWWGDRTGGWIGGGIGGMLGLVGALIGMLQARGKGASVASALMLASTGLGIILLVAGIVAVCLRQPYAVYYPLLLSGFLATAIFGGLYVLGRRLRLQGELRKMRAMDA